MDADTNDRQPRVRVEGSENGARLDGKDIDLSTFTAAGSNRKLKLKLVHSAVSCHEPITTTLPVVHTKDHSLSRHNTHVVTGRYRRGPGEQTLQLNVRLNWIDRATGAQANTSFEPVSPCEYQRAMRFYKGTSAADKQRSSRLAGRDGVALAKQAGLDELGSRVTGAVTLPYERNAVQTHREKSEALHRRADPTCS
jgi:hypothetical protein